jgi:molybdenum cofactor biosynthesis enzyme MoaA
MSLKVRFLLTNKCSARCDYCHNEGQAKARDFLSVERIVAFLDELQTENRIPTEVILSGGEPTLHPQIGEIARLCKSRGIFVSMDTHGGHPKRLVKALPYLDELKLHIDSFDAYEQRQSMGINIERGLESIALAKEFPLALRVNHPLRSAVKTTEFVTQAHQIGIDCKIIEMFGEETLTAPLADMDWASMDYVYQKEGCWLHADGKHQIFTKRCGHQHNIGETYFVGATGVRHHLDGEEVDRVAKYPIRQLKVLQ